MIDRYDAPLLDAVLRHPSLESCLDDLQRILDLMSSCFEAGGKVLACGNGGSASDAGHLTSELMKQFKIQRGVDADFADEVHDRYGEDESVHLIRHLHGALPALDLSAQSSLLTAVANDEDADFIFAQQVYGYGKAGDVLVAFSTSGSSKNILYAAQVALARGMEVVAFTGQAQSPLSLLATETVRVQETETYCIQELHLPAYHALCAALEERFFGCGSL